MPVVKYLILEPECPNSLNDWLLVSENNFIFLSVIIAYNLVDSQQHYWWVDHQNSVAQMHTNTILLYRYIKINIVFPWLLIFK